jgi:hypothetical protein
VCRESGIDEPSCLDIMNVKTPIAGNPDEKDIWLRSYKRLVIWTRGHSQEGIRSGRELIGDWGIESTETLDSRKLETSKPEIKSEKSAVRCKRSCG